MTDPLDNANPLSLLARHVTETRLEDIPEAALGAAKTFLLDTLGVAIAGSGEDWGRRLPAVAAGWGGGGETGGTGGEAEVWGAGLRFPAGNAALVAVTAWGKIEYGEIEAGSTEALEASGRRMQRCA